MDKNIFIESLPSDRLFKYSRFFFILSSLGRKEDKERNRYLGGLLLWKGKVLQRNERRKGKRKKAINISSASECQILQFPTTESA